MSTRSEIGIYENESDEIQSANVFLYRHSDGMPESVLPEIKPFLLKFNKVRGISDSEYCLARLTQHLTNLQNAYQKEMFDRIGRTDSAYEKECFLLGYGIVTDLHGDIEWFYHISPTAIKVYAVTSEDPKQWLLKKTVKLPAGRKMEVA